MFFINRKFRVGTPVSYLEKTIEILEKYDITYAKPNYHKSEVIGRKLITCFIDCYASEEKLEKMIVDLKNDSKGLHINITY